MLKITKRNKFFLAIFLTVFIQPIIFGQELYDLQILNQEKTTQLSQYGITWYFEEPVEYGQYITGDWWVIGPINIIKIDPSSIGVNGRTINGSMVSPPQGPLQGYDSASVDGGWTPSLNVAFGINQNNPLYLPSDSSLISTISIDDVPMANGARNVIAYSAVLTVLNDKPSSDSFRLPFSGTDKDKFSYNFSDLDLSIISNTGMDSTVSAPSWESIENSLKGARTAEHISQFRLRPLAPYYFYDAYGREFAAVGGDAIMMLLCDDFSIEQKQKSLISIIQIGIDLSAIFDQWYSVDQNAWWNGGAGRKQIIMFAAKLLGNTEILDKIRLLPHTYKTAFYEDMQTFIVNQNVIDVTNSSAWSPDYRSPNPQPYETAHLGMPEWGLRGIFYPSRTDSSWTASYRSVYATMWGQALAIEVLGLRDDWNHEPFFLYANRYMTIMETGIDPYGFTVADMHVSSSRGTAFVTEMFEKYWNY